jgi:hypothetical protein
MNEPKRHTPIPTVRTDIPKRISEPPRPDHSRLRGVPDDQGRNQRYKDRLQKELDGAKEPKPTLKEKAMNALLNQLLAFVKTWLYGRPVYKTRKNEYSGEIEFILDKDGKKIMNIPLTILGRILQVTGALGLLSVVVGGKPISEWVPILTDLIRLITGG